MSNSIRQPLRPMLVVGLALTVFIVSAASTWPGSVLAQVEEKCQYVVRSAAPYEIAPGLWSACSIQIGATICGDCVITPGGNEACPETLDIRRDGCDLRLASAGDSVTGACIQCSEGGGPQTSLDLQGFEYVLFQPEPQLPGQARAEHLDDALRQRDYGDAVRAVFGITASGQSIEETLRQVVVEQRHGAVTEKAWLELAKALESGADARALRQNWQKRMPLLRTGSFDPEQWPLGDPGELFELPREMMRRAQLLKTSNAEGAASLGRAALLLEAEVYVYLPPLFLNAAVASNERAGHFKWITQSSDEELRGLRQVAEQVRSDAAPRETALSGVVQRLQRESATQPLTPVELEQLANAATKVLSSVEQRPAIIYFPLLAVAKAKALIQDRNGQEAAGQLAARVRESFEPADDEVIVAWTNRALSGE